MRASRRATLLVLAVLVALSPAAAKKKKPGSLLLPEGYPPITEEELALREVPYAPGAPAAVLLEAEQNDWQGLDMVQVRYVRRLKILTDAGVDDYGDFSYVLHSDMRVKSATARTVLPDGTEVDGSDGVHQETSDAGYQILRVAFPRVQAGAILDLYVSFNADNALAVMPWVMQESIPVLESRFTMIPPEGLQYRTFTIPPDDEGNHPERVRFGRDMAFVWSFKDLPPIPAETNLPPLQDISKRLFVVLESYKDSFQYLPISTDWKSYAELMSGYWEDWMSKGKGQAEALARQVAPAEGGPAAKAEAIRRALRERVRVDYISESPRRDSADEVLSAGSGTTADLAAAAAVMLRAVGVPADLTEIRRRSDGAIPADFPIPAMFNDVLVRIPTEEGGLFISPGSDLAAGRLPWDCTGLLAAVIDRQSGKPVVIPDVPADQNSTRRSVEATLDARGNLAGDATLTLHGMAAEPWRRRLRDADDEQRRERVEEELRDWMGGAKVTSVAFEGMDEAADDLVVRCSFEAPGFATPAGKRLLVNPVLFDRVLAEDWAAEERRYGINLRVARETIDTVTLRLPEGVTDVTLPEGADLKAEPAGFYRASYESKGGSIVLQRHFRLDLYSFPPQAWNGLRGWFNTMAQADDRPVVLTLG